LKRFVTRVSRLCHTDFICVESTVLGLSSFQSDGAFDVMKASVRRLALVLGRAPHGVNEVFKEVMRRLADFDRGLHMSDFLFDKPWE
jgi:hypothetical protein